MTLLKGKLTTLRGPEPDDLDCLYLWENDASLWAFGSTRAPMTRHQLWQYIDSYDGDIFSDKQLRMIIVDNESGAPAGTIDLYDFDPRDGRAKVGIFVAPGFRRKGFASEALSMTESFAKDMIGMHQLAALVAADNEPSMSLFSRSGYSTCGRLRSWIKQGRDYCDVMIFQKLLG